MQVEVKHSYYLGTYYRIYSLLENGRSVYFDHPNPIEKGRKVFLNVSLETINKRLPV